MNYSFIVKVSMDKIYVDPAGVCGGNLPCFRSIQEALDFELYSDTTTLYIYPGNYTNFNISKGKGLIGVEPGVVFFDRFYFSDLINYTISNVILNFSNYGVYFSNIRRVIINNSSLLFSYNYNIYLLSTDQYNSEFIINNSEMILQSIDYSSNYYIYYYNRGKIVLNNIQARISGSNQIVPYIFSFSSNTLILNNISIPLGNLPNYYTGYEYIFHNLQLWSNNEVYIKDLRVFGNISKPYLFTLQYPPNKIEVENFLLIVNNTSYSIGIFKDKSDLNLNSDILLYVENVSNSNIINRYMFPVILNYRGYPYSLVILNSKNINTTIQADKFANYYIYNLSDSIVEFSVSEFSNFSSGYINSYSSSIYYVNNSYINYKNKYSQFDLYVYYFSNFTIDGLNTKYAYLYNYIDQTLFPINLSSIIIHNSNIINLISSNTIQNIPNTTSLYIINSSNITNLEIRDDSNTNLQGIKYLYNISNSILNRILYDNYYNSAFKELNITIYNSSILNHYRDFDLVSGERFPITHGIFFSRNNLHPNTSIYLINSTIINPANSWIYASSINKINVIVENSSIFDIGAVPESIRIDSRNVNLSELCNTDQDYLELTTSEPSLCILYSFGQVIDYSAGISHKLRLNNSPMRYGDLEYSVVCYELIDIALNIDGSFENVTNVRGLYLSNFVRDSNRSYRGNFSYGTRTGTSQAEVYLDSNLSNQIPDDQMILIFSISTISNSSSWSSSYAILPSYSSLSYSNIVFSGEWVPYVLYIPKSSIRTSNINLFRATGSFRSRDASFIDELYVARPNITYMCKGSQYKVLDNIFITEYKFSIDQTISNYSSLLIEHPIFNTTGLVSYLSEQSLDYIYRSNSIGSSRNLLGITNRSISNTIIYGISEIIKNPKNDFTISLWFKGLGEKVYAGNSIVIRLNDPLSYSNCFIEFYNRPNYHCVDSNNNRRQLLSRWNHLAVSYNSSSNRLIAYLNGVLVLNVSSISNHLRTNSISIGNDVDEIFIFDRVLGFEEIDFIRNLGYISSNLSVKLIDQSNNEYDLDYYLESIDRLWVKLPELQPGNYTIRISTPGDRSPSNSVIPHQNSSSYIIIPDSYELRAVSYNNNTVHTSNLISILNDTNIFYKIFRTSNGFETQMYNLNQNSDSPYIATHNLDFEDGLVGWITGGNSEWYVQTEYKSSRNRAARSGGISDNQNTYLATNIEVRRPLRISFDYLTSSESYYDYLYFCVNNLNNFICDENNYVFRYSGVMNSWGSYSYDIQPGNYTLVWSYVKDCCYLSGLDAVFVDNIRFEEIQNYSSYFISDLLGIGQFEIVVKALDNRSYIGVKGARYYEFLNNTYSNLSYLNLDNNIKSITLSYLPKNYSIEYLKPRGCYISSPQKIIEDNMFRLVIRTYESDINCTISIDNTQTSYILSNTRFTFNYSLAEGVRYVYNVSCFKDQELLCGLNNTEVVYYSWFNNSYQAREIFNINVTKAGVIPIYLNTSKIFSQNLLATVIINNTQQEVPIFPISINPELVYVLANINSTLYNSSLILYHKAEGVKDYSREHIFKQYFDSFLNTSKVGRWNTIDSLSLELDNSTGVIIAGALQRLYSSSGNYYPNREISFNISYYGSNNNISAKYKICSSGSECWYDYTYLHPSMGLRIQGYRNDITYKYDNWGTVYYNIRFPLYIVYFGNRVDHLSYSYLNDNNKLPSTYATIPSINIGNISRIVINNQYPIISDNYFLKYDVGYIATFDAGNASIVYLESIDRNPQIDLSYQLPIEHNQRDIRLKFTQNRNCSIDNTIIPNLGSLRLIGSNITYVNCSNYIRYVYYDSENIITEILDQAEINSNPYEFSIRVNSTISNYSICTLSTPTSQIEFIAPTNQIFRVNNSVRVGSNNILLRCVGIGDYSYQSQKTLITNFPPVINIINPQNNSFIDSPIINIKYNIDDEQPSSVGCLIYLNDTLIGNYTGTNIDFDYVLLQAGYYRLRIVCNDNRSITEKEIVFAKTGEGYCNGCLDCSQKVQDRLYNTLILFDDIYATAGEEICINLNRSIRLICDNKMIVGNGSGVGILVNATNVLIENCKISNFNIGILQNSTNSGYRLRNVLSSHNNYGIINARSVGLIEYSEFKFNNIYDILNLSNTLDMYEVVCNTYNGITGCSRGYYEDYVPEINYSYNKYVNNLTISINITPFDKYSQYTYCSVNNVSNISILRFRSGILNHTIQPVTYQNLTLLCWDDNNNKNISTLELIYDAHPPEIIVYHPEPNSIHVGNSFYYEFEVRDDIADNITCFIDNILIGNYSNGSLVTGYYIKPVGMHNINISCYDYSNNHAQIIIPIEIRNSYLNITPNSVNRDLELGREIELSFNISPLVVDSLNNVILFIRNCNIDCQLSSNLINNLTNRYTVNLTIRAPSNYYQNIVRMELVAIESSYNTTFTVPITIKITKPDLSVTANQSTYILDSEYNVSLNITNLGEGTSYDTEILSISCPNGIMCNFSLPNQFNLSSNQSILIYGNISPSYNYINGSADIRVRFRNYLGVVDKTIRINILQPRITIPISSAFVSDQPSDQLITVRNIGGSEAKDMVIQLICPAGFGCDLNSTDIEKILPNSSVNLSARLQLFNSIYDGNGTIKIIDRAGRIFESRLVLRIAKPELTAISSDRLDYGDNNVSIIIINNGTRATNPVNIRLRNCNYCNQTEWNLDEIDINSNVTLKLIIRMPLEYSIPTYNISIEILENTGRSWSIPISYRVPQAVLVVNISPRILDKTLNLLNVQINNTGDYNLTGFSAVFDCPVLWTCNSSGPFNLASNHSISLPLSIEVPAGEYTENYLIALKVYKDNKTYSIPVQFRVKQPDVDIYYNITTSPGTRANYTIQIKNNGSYIIEETYLNNSIPYESFEIILHNTSITNILPNQTVNITVEISVPQAEMLRTRLFRLNILDKYGKVWQKDILIRIDQPDLKIEQFPMYLELGENLFKLNITNNGSYVLKDVIFQLLCQDSSSYILNNSLITLEPDQSILLDAYINMVRVDQSCRLIAYNENRSLERNIMIRAKRMNLQISHNLPSRIRVGETINASMFIRNLEPYPVEIMVWIVCRDGLLCNTSYDNYEINPNEIIQYNFTVLNPISNSHNYPKIEFFRSYRSIIIASTNYTIMNVKPQLGILSNTVFNISENNTHSFSIVNQGIPTYINISLVCPDYLLCNTSISNAYLNENEIIDVQFTVQSLGITQETELVHILVSTPSVNFSRPINLIFDNDILIELENRSLLLGNNLLQITIKNRRNFSQNITCNIECKVGWVCGLNNTEFFISENESINLSALINIPWFENVSSGRINVSCLSNSTRNIKVKSYDIILPILDFELNYSALEFGINTLNLTIYRDLNYNNLPISVDCIGCNLSNNLINLNNDTSVNVTISLPSSYISNFYNISILVTDGIRARIKNYSIPTNIPIIQIISSPIIGISRNSSLVVPIRLINVGNKNAENVIMNLECLGVQCNNDIYVGNISRGDTKIIPINVSKGFNLDANIIRIYIKTGMQEFNHSILFNTLSPRLIIEVINTTEVVLNTTVTIPFRIHNIGNDVALLLNSNISCPAAIECIIEQFDQNYNLLPSQSRNGIIRTSLPETVTSPFYISLIAREINFEQIANIQIIPILPLTFESINPNFTIQSWSLNASAITVGDINGDGVNNIIFSNSTGTFAIDPISKSITMLSNKSYGSLTTGYIYGSNRINIIGIADNMVHVDFVNVFNTTIRNRVITSTDVDGDGKYDLGIVSDNNIFTIYYNRNSEFIRSNISIPIDGISITSLDFDDDGNIDFVIGDRLGQINIITYPYQNISYVTRNLNNHRDLVVTISDPLLRNRSSIVTGDAGGEIEINYIDNASIFKKTIINHISLISGVVSIDIDRDGDLDIILIDNLGRLHIYTSRSILNKRVSRTYSVLDIKTDIINPYFADMINVTYLDSWNPGEVSPSLQNIVRIKYIYPNGSIYTINQNYNWLGNGVSIRLPRDIPPYTRVILEYSLVTNTSIPIILNPEIRYYRISPQTKNLGVLISDHLTERSPYSIINLIDRPYVRVIDTGDISGEFPDLAYLALNYSDVSWMKYVTYSQDPNVCAYDTYSCSSFDRFCITDPIRTNRIILKSSSPYIPQSIISSEPVYGSIIHISSNIRNIGELAATAQIGIYLNNIMIYQYDQSLPVNISNISPTLHPRYTSYRLGLGNYKIRGVIDPLNILPELRKDNNILERNFSVDKYADYVLNSVTLTRSDSTPTNTFSGSERLIIVVNISNLGNTPGYVLLNASIDGQEIWNGNAVGTISCHYGRKPILIGPIPPNSSILANMTPVLLPNINRPTNHTLRVSIYNHITGYPEDINISNNRVLEANFTIIPYPAELDFYNSSLINGVLTSPKPPMFNIEYYPNRHDMIKTINVTVFNLGGQDANTNYSVYVYNATFTSMNQIDLLQIINNSDKLTNGNVYVPSLSKTELSLALNYNFTNPMMNYSIIILLDRVGNEDILSNILVITYSPIDYKLIVQPNTEYPLEDSTLDLRVLVNTTGGGNSIGYRSLIRNGNRLEISSNPDTYITIPLRNVSMHIYLNNSIQNILVSNITLPNVPIYITLPISLVNHTNISNLTVVFDPDDLLPNELNIFNRNSVLLRTPSFRAPNVSVVANLYKQSINRINISYSSDDESCSYLDNIVIYLNYNNSSILLYSEGEFAKPPMTANIITICQQNRPITKEYYVYIPNISGNAELIVELYRGLSYDSSSTGLDGKSRIKLPAYDKLFIQANSTIIYNSTTIIVNERHPHDITGIIPANVLVELNNQAKFYIYRKYIYRYNVTISDRSTIEVNVK